MRLALLLCVACGLLHAASARAADADSSSRLQFTGQVHRGTCQLSPDSVERRVLLPRLPLGLFTGVGALVGETAFTLGLSGCDGIVQSLHFEFQPEGNVYLMGQRQWFANVATDLPASGTGVALFTDAGVNVLQSDGSSDVRLLPTADQRYAFRARYVQTAARVRAGRVQTRVVIHVRYD